MLNKNEDCSKRPREGHRLMGRRKAMRPDTDKVDERGDIRQCEGRGRGTGKKQNCVGDPRANDEKTKE